MSDYAVSRGQVSTGIVLDDSGDRATVFSGGTANMTVVTVGILTISSGGTANDTTVNRTGALVKVCSGGIANFTTINSGGVHVYSGGTANDTVLNHGGEMYVFAGGTASILFTTPWGGTVGIDSGATVTFLRDAKVYYGCYSSGVISKCNSISGLRVVSGNTAFVYESGSATDTTVNSGGHMFIASEGSANDIIVTRGGSLWVNRGGNARGVTLSAGGRLGNFSFGEDRYFGTIADGTAMVTENVIISTTDALHDVMSIFDGGTMSSVTVYYGGYLYVSGGGTAINTTATYGYLYVSSDGTASDTILSGGDMTVSGGGTAYHTLVTDHGGIHVSSGGFAADTALDEFGNMDIGRGASAHRITVTNRGEMQVSGGIVEEVILGDGGTGTVSYGGSATDVIISGGGRMFVHYDGVTSNTTVNAGATMTILSGTQRGVLQIASGAVVSAYSDSYSVIDFTLSERSTDDGYLINDLSRISGAPTYTITVTANQSAGIYNLAQGAENFSGSISIGDGTTTYGELTINGADLNHGDNRYSLLRTNGNLTLSIATPDAPVRIFSSGTQVSCGTVLNDATLVEHNHMIVSSGGTATGTTVYGNGKVLVSDGGVTNRTTVCGVTSSGGWIYVSSGGTANNTTVNYSGYLVVSDGGMANDTVLNVLGCLSIHSGGTATRITLNALGFFAISSGGTASGISMRGGAMHLFGGTTIDTIVSSGWIHVSSGGTANQTRVGSLGDMYVSSGGSAIETTIDSAGNLLIYYGGTANSNTVNSGGKLYVYSGGTANSATVNSGGNMVVSSGGTATRTTINDGKLYVYSGGTANWNEINSAGRLYVYSGGTANNTSVTDGRAALYVYDGGTANSNTINSGWLLVCDGGTANSNVLDSGGKLHVSSGGTANSTTVNSGWLHIYSSGTANWNEINSAGRLYVSSGGIANHTTVTDGPAALYVYDDGTANSNTINSGWLLVCDGGMANSNVLNSGGKLHVSSGGIASDTAISNGRMYVSSGAIHRGTLQIASDGFVSAYAGSIIDFTLAGRTANDGCLINDLSRISGAPTYTITITANQSAGTYNLAQGAADFNGSITISNGTVEYGTLCANGDLLKYGDSYYLLELADTELMLSIFDNKLSWEDSGAEGYILEYSADNFEHAIRMTVDSTSLGTFNIPMGRYAWRVRPADGTEEWSQTNRIANGESGNTAPVLFTASDDGNADLFFTQSSGTWGSFFSARHEGTLDGWQGTHELVYLKGKNRIADVFAGSTDANILVLTDDANGDALFVDDIYTALPDGLTDQARIAQIKEIRAGAGDDVVDLTSQQFAYTNGLTVYGGLGDDTIWANTGSNRLFGDAGNDRIIGAAGDDLIVGGIGNDRMHGGGGNDVFTFCENWGNDTVEQLPGGSVTLWFASGTLDNWNASTLTYSDGENSVTVSGITAENITLKFGDDLSTEYTNLSASGAFTAAASEKIFEDKAQGLLA